VDVGVRLDGFCTDAARTFAVGNITDNAKNLLDATERCFWVATDGLKAGDRVGEIGEKIEKYIKANTNYGILTQYFGHGIGRKVHEDPLIPNYIPTNPQIKNICKQHLAENTVICIEPMINEGTRDTKTLSDGWTVITADGKLSAHYENTLIIKADGVEVLTDKYI
jgi:methionyl aminopeptidase